MPRHLPTLPGLNQGWTHCPALDVVLCYGLANNSIIPPNSLLVVLLCLLLSICIVYTQARNQGAKPPLKYFSLPLEKCVGHYLQNFAPSQNSSPHLVSQAGYGTCTLCVLVRYGLRVCYKELENIKEIYQEMHLFLQTIKVKKIT